MIELVRYDAACRAIAEAHSVDEVKEIRDRAAALKAYARQAKNKDLEAEAAAIRLRAERGIGQLMEAQRGAGLLSKGTPGPGRGKAGLSANPAFDAPPTLAEVGINKNLAHQARVLAKLSDDAFETVITDASVAVQRAVKNVVRSAEHKQERADGYESRILNGCDLTDLDALAASGYRASVIAADPPWEFEAYSGKGKARSADRYYDTPPLEWLLNEWAPRVEALAAKDSVLLPWAICPELPGALELIKACGFEYKTKAFCWEKLNADGTPFMGMGFYTRANTEDCLLATRGSPKRLDKGVMQIIRAPATDEHSEKPDEAYSRMQRLFAGPYLELFGRKLRPGWTVWGNEIQRADFTARANSAATADEAASSPTNNQIEGFLK